MESDLTPLFLFSNCKTSKTDENNKVSNEVMINNSLYVHQTVKSSIK